MTVILFSPTLNSTSAEKLPCSSSRAATPCTSTSLTPDSSVACPATVILLACVLSFNPRSSCGEVILICGGVVSFAAVSPALPPDGLTPPPGRVSFEFGDSI